ncbi:MAG TPA: deoxyguanosinetriphosphate triphosphohydrolase [bacterium]|nr:deoxyguanosinetriphosphate triphosphohydrolase [bacterium]
MRTSFSIREHLEQIESQTLSPHACLSTRSKGRERDEKPCPIRPVFQHDRDRIVHSKAFRRLKDKTQVFLSPEGGHYRNRLTHTLEVSQIARTIARALSLNEQLTEAIAMGHDLGHTPFGHSGERALARLLPGGFRHEAQSLRMVETLSRRGAGLNLSFEVRDGIAKHSKGKGKLLKKEGIPATLEGQVVRLADIIAYVNHDIDDAMNGGFMQEKDMPCADLLGRRVSVRINRMVFDLIQTSMDSLQAGDIRILMSDRMAAAIEEVRDFLYEEVYEAPAIRHEFEKAERIVKALFDHFRDHYEHLSRFYEPLVAPEPERNIGDFIASLTDGYAIELYRHLFIPERLPYREFAHDDET